MEHDEPRPTVTILSNDLPLERLLKLRDRYRHALTEPGPDDPPDWYAAGVVEQAERILAERKAVAS